MNANKKDRLAISEREPFTAKNNRSFNRCWTCLGSPAERGKIAQQGTSRYKNKNFDRPRDHPNCSAETGRDRKFSRSRSGGRKL
jgi:hypothetical protein